MEQGKGTSDVNCTSGSSLPDPIFTWLHYYLDLEVPSCCFSPRKEGQDVHRLPIAFPLTNSECCTHFHGEWWVGVVMPCFFFDSLHQVEALLWSQESRGRWRLTWAVFTSANARGQIPICSWASDICVFHKLCFCRKAEEKHLLLRSFFVIS